MVQDTSPSRECNHSTDRGDQTLIIKQSLHHVDLLELNFVPPVVQEGLPLVLETVNTNTGFSPSSRI